MRKLYQYDEQKRHPHLLEEHYFHKLNPSLVYAGVQEECPGPQNVMHTHPFVEVAFFWAGSGYVILEGQRYPVQKNDLMVFNAGKTHCEYSDETSPLSFYFTAYDKLSIPNLPKNQLLATNVPPVLHVGDMFGTFQNLFAVVLDDLAEACMVSKYHLAHLFSEKIGKPAGQYILDKRIYAAKRLLSTTSRSVDQISGECGFNNSTYFCRIFKKVTGETPTQYRRK